MKKYQLDDLDYIMWMNKDELHDLNMKRMNKDKVDDLVLITRMNND